MKMGLNKTVLRLAAGLVTVAMLLASCTKTPADGSETTADGTEKNEQNVPLGGAMAVYYVSPSGSDENDGKSADKAFATLAKARDTVRAINKDMTGDIIVYLLDGVWELDETLKFEKQDAATNGYSIRYVAADGSSPLISGGTELEGEWTVHTTLGNGNTIYKIPLDRDVKLRALYVNGERRYMASSGGAIAARGSWGGYNIGEVPAEDEFSWNSVYKESFEALTNVSESEEIKAWAKSGNAANAVLNIKSEDGNSFIEIAHTANEDCGFELPGVTYRNAIISIRIQFSGDHRFSHEWEALHIHGANSVIDGNGRTKWAGIKLAPHLGQTYFQYGTSGGSLGDDVGSQQNTTAFTAKPSAWYKIKMMVTDDGYYYTKLWQEGADEPEDWSRFERFDNLNSTDKFFRIYAYKNNNASKISVRVDDIEIKAGTLKNSGGGNSLPEWAWSAGSKFDGIMYSKDGTASPASDTVIRVK